MPPESLKVAIEDAPAPRRDTLREQVAGTVKVVLLVAVLLGGLWMLQMIAKS